MSAELDVTAESPHLTSARLELRRQAREFSLEHVLPVANRLDPLREEIPDSLLDRLRDHGYFGILIDREHGGLGLGVFEYCLIAEELARGWMSVASVIARANGTGTGVADPNRRSDLLRRSAAGEWIAGVAFSEPGAGSDLAAVSCEAVRDGDQYLVRGEKRWCGWALRADFILLLARTSPERIAGLETFIVEKPRGAFPPGIAGKMIDKIGYFGISSYSLHIDGLRVPVANKLGAAQQEAGEGFYDTVRLLNTARVHTAARAVGLARGAIEDASAYAQHREQFGRPLAQFQVLRHKLADMLTAVEAARQLYYYAAHLLDCGARCEKECSMAKLFASEMAEHVCSDALQILGGNGYTTEHAVERYWRDARLTKIFEGTSEIQRTVIASRHLGDQ